VANRYWLGAGTWDGANTANWASAAGISLPGASCSGTALTTTNLPALVNGMTVWSDTGVSLGTITGGSGDAWTVSIGGTYAAQTMAAQTMGASVPGLTGNDDVFFDANSISCTLGADTPTSPNPGVRLVNQTGFTGTLIGTGYTINIITSAGAALTVWNGSASCTNTNVSCNLLASTATTRTVLGGTVTEANSVKFTISAGGGTVTAGGNMRSLVVTSGFTGTLGNVARTVFGDFTIASGVPVASGTQVTTFSGNIGTRVIRTNGVTLDFPVVIGVTSTGTGAWQLFDNLTVGSTRAVTFAAGTLDLNGKVLSCGQFLSSNSNTRTLTVNGGGITVTGTAGGTLWSMAGSTGLTITTPFTVTVDANTATASTVTPGTLSESQSLSFNFVSGSYALSLFSSGGTLRDLTFGPGFTGSWSAISGSSNIYGNLTLGANMTATPSSASALSFGATSGARTITSNGKALDVPVIFNAGAGGTATWSLQDQFRIGSTRRCTLTNGTLNLNGKTMFVGAFETGSGAKTLAFNSGILVCTGSGATAFNNVQPTNFTTTGPTGAIQMSSASAKTFVGGGRTYAAILQQAGVGGLTITGANTFQDIQATAVGVPSTIQLPAGVTTTVSTFSLSGSGGAVVTLTSSTGTSQATLLDNTGGTNNVSFLNISWINASPTNSTIWNAFTTNGNVNSGNNNGWIFAGSATGSAGLSWGQGLYAGSSGLYRGGSGLYNGFPGLDN
jgi:hypothetical protein